MAARKENFVGGCGESLETRAEASRKFPERKFLMPPKTCHPEQVLVCDKQTHTQSKDPAPADISTGRSRSCSDTSSFGKETASGRAANAA